MYNQSISRLCTNQTNYDAYQNVINDNINLNIKLKEEEEIDKMQPGSQHLPKNQR